MRLNIFRALSALAIGVSLFAGCQPAAESVAKPASQTPADSIVLISSTQPADLANSATQQAELLQPTDEMVGYGEERYRLVSTDDEIIAVLTNGATVLCKRVVSPAVSVRGYVYTGGVYEGRWLGGGLSHLLEHLVAGGSNEKRTEAENRDLLQKIGNDSNAYTTSDHTAYFINTTTENMEPAVDLVCNWMLGAKITEAEYRREYQVVQRELEMGKGEPDRVFYYLCHSNRYRVSPARVPVIGYQEVIQGLSRDDVYEYYKLAYVPNNLVFSVCGDLPTEQMLAAVKKQLKHAKPGRDFDRDIPAEPPVTAPRTVVGTFPGLGQAKLELAFPSIELSHPDLYPLDLLATALGGGESSILIEELRDRRQLVSSVSVFSDTPHYVDGTFQITMELEPEKIPDATTAVLEILERVKKEGIEVSRLARAKTQTRASRVKNEQTAEDVASFLATDYMATGDPHFTRSYVERIDSAPPEAVQAVAQKYLVPSRLLTTALVPAEFAPKLPAAVDLLRKVSPAATQPTTPAAASPIVRVELNPGTTLLSRRISTSPLVVIQGYSLGGVTAENAETNGLGNLAMQMTTRGTTSMDARQIAEFWDSIGGDFSAECQNNTCTWSATCLKEDFEKAYAAFVEQINEPTFAEAELPMVKQRIAAGIRSQDADWADQAFRFYNKSFYGPTGSPYQFTAAGPLENLESFTAQQAADWYRKQVLPAKKVIAVFGDVSAEAVERAARRTPLAGSETPPPTDARISARPGSEVWSTAAPTTAPTGQPTTPATQPNVPFVRVVDVAINKTEQALAGIVVGYSADSVSGDDDNYALAVGDTMASGYQYGAGYLYEILRGRGLVYVVHGINSPGRSEKLPGSFIVYAGCEPDKVDEVLDVILENVARLQGTSEQVNADWFSRSKELIVVADALEHQTPAQQAQQAAVDELYGLGYARHAEFVPRVKAVELAEVRSAARRRLSQCLITVSTPKPELIKSRAGMKVYRDFKPIEVTPRGTQHDTSG